MKRIVSISLGASQRDYHIATTVLGQQIDIHRVGTAGDSARAAQLVRAYDGRVDAIGLGDGLGAFRIGTARYIHRDILQIAAQAQHTPVLDGGGLRGILERWTIRRLADRVPGAVQQRRVLLLHGAENYQMARALVEQGAAVRCADPILHSGLAIAPVLGSLRQLEGYAATALPLHLLRPLAGDNLIPVRPRVANRLAHLCRWADVIVGRCSALLSYLPEDLRGRLVVTDDPSPQEVAALQARGVRMLVTMHPPLHVAQPFVATDVLEAAVTAIEDATTAPDDATMLDFLARANWEPTIQTLSDDGHVSRFAFVVHPLKTHHIYRGIRYSGLVRYLPSPLVERIAALVPPLVLSHMRGIRSAATGKEVEGVLLTLGSTPRQMLRRPPAATYRQLVAAGRLAERMGARIMGLGAFTSVVGDAGLTVAQQSVIGVTTGNALTVAATLETARVALRAMGKDLQHVRAMVVGATGSIGAACSRMLAPEVSELVLAAPRPERLLLLKQQIERETPGVRVLATTDAAARCVAQVDLIVMTTSALSDQLLDVQRLKPGAVICDVARPANVRQEDAARRPDVLVIESGEVVLPGTPDLGFDIDLPNGIVYACLAETALLALEGRYEDYTIGRTIAIEQVEEIARLMHKHGLEVGALRSFGRYLSAVDIAEKRYLAQRLQNGQRESEQQPWPPLAYPAPVTARS